jgi:hypothetical protein
MYVGTVQIALHERNREKQVHLDHSLKYKHAIGDLFFQMQAKPASASIDSTQTFYCIVRVVGISKNYKCATGDLIVFKMFS